MFINRDTPYPDTPSWISNEQDEEALEKVTNPVLELDAHWENDYIKEYTKVKDSFVKSISSLSDVGLWKAFSQKNSLDPFCKEFSEKCDSISSYSLDSGSETVVPNAQALHYLVKRYQEKYGIHILVVPDFKRLTSLLDQLNRLEPQYMGVIIGQALSSDLSHVTPLLFYLPGNGERQKMECLILDSIGSDEYSQDLYNEYGLEKKNIYSTSKPRQADRYSCRTGALTLLRNALLYLKYYDHKEGFAQALEEGEVDSQSIIFLPPQWDYTDQIENKKLNKTHIVIRNFFSKKNKLQESALDHRLKHTEEKEFTCTIWKNQGGVCITQKPPEGVIEFQLNPPYMNLKFRITRKVNTFLLTKGIRNSQL